MPINMLAFVSAITLGIIFLVSGVSKARDLDGFVLGVLNYQILPPRLGSIYARILPLIEIGTGGLLFLGIWPTLAGLLSIGLLMSFLVAVSINIRRGRKIDCHCFGSQQKEPLGVVTIIRLCVLLAGALLVTKWQDQNILELEMMDLIPALLVSTGLGLVLYLLHAIPLAWRVWRIKPVLGVTRGGGRISLRRQPVGKSIFDTPASDFASEKEGGVL